MNFKSGALDQSWYIKRSEVGKITIAAMLRSETTSSKLQHLERSLAGCEWNQFRTECGGAESHLDGVIQETLILSGHADKYRDEAVPTAIFTMKAIEFTTNSTVAKRYAPSA